MTPEPSPESVSIWTTEGLTAAATAAMGSCVEALLLAALGKVGEAEALARNGLAVASDEMDNSWLEAWGYEDLATVLERAGRIDEARAALESSLATWERKGCLPCAERIRAQIDALGRTEV